MSEAKVAEKKPGAGLEDVVAGESSICYIDGLKGVLRYRGYPIQELAERASFEEVVYLLWNGDLPGRAELEQFRGTLDAAGPVPEPVYDALRALPKDIHPMAAVRTAVSVAGHYDPDAEAGPRDAQAARRSAARLQAWVVGIVAAWDRIRRGKAPLAPRPGLSLAAQYFYLTNGAPASETAVRVFDQCLTLHADHELNASTFAARVVAATLSDVYSSVVGAIGALKGPLHGGANTDVMKMLLEIDAQGKGPEGAKPWVEGALAAKRKISGFGHRVYRAPDPRATKLKELSALTAKDAGEPTWYELSLAVERAFSELKNLPANVDFFSASAYYALGISPDMYTPIFAVSRMSGWLAHVLEQYANNRLIRPRADYVGSGERSVRPLAERG
jgi:citrate synthase